MIASIKSPKLNGNVSMKKMKVLAVSLLKREISRKANTQKKFPLPVKLTLTVLPLNSKPVNLDATLLLAKLGILTLRLPLRELA